jgi:hypothetical protein
MSVVMLYQKTPNDFTQIVDFSIGFFKKKLEINVVQSKYLLLVIK